MKKFVVYEKLGPALFVYIICFLVFSFCGALVMNAPLWAGFLVAFALYICSLFPMLLIVLVLYLIVAAIINLPSIESFGVVVSVAVVALISYMNHRKNDEHKGDPT